MASLGFLDAVDSQSHKIYQPNTILSTCWEVQAGEI